MPSDILELNDTQIETKINEMRHKNAQRLEEAIKKADKMQSQMEDVAKI